MSEGVDRSHTSIWQQMQDSLRDSRDSDDEEDVIVGGGGGPHDPTMEVRVTALENDMKEVKASLGRLEVSSARIESTLTNLATRADAATAIERIASLDGRTTRLETAVTDTVKSAVSKAIGPWQLPAVLGASGGVVVLIVAALGWLAHQPWFHG